MKKFKSALHWIWVLTAYIIAFTIFGIIIALTLDLPDTMLGGMASLWLIVSGKMRA